MNAYEILMHRLGGMATNDARDRWHYDCPFCGAEGWKGHAPLYHAYTYLADDGARMSVCHVCGWFGGIARLVAKIAADLGDAIDWTERRAAALDERPDPHWKNNPAFLEHWMAECERKAEAIAKLWNSYKPVTAETVKREYLSTWTLPYWDAEGKQWKPGHSARLVVPMIDWERRVIVGLRGRAFTDGKKDWQTAAKSDEMLLGLDRVTPGSRVIWCENVVDRLLAQQAKPSIVAIASGGLIFRDHWIADLAARRPEQVIVWFDHDLSGNGSPHHAAEFTAAWEATIRERRSLRNTPAHVPFPTPPSPAGIRLANKLCEAGVKARLFAWPKGTPRGMDIGSYLIEQEDCYATWTPIPHDPRRAHRAA